MALRIVLGCSSYFIPRGGIAYFNQEAHAALERAGYDVLVASPDVPVDADERFLGFKVARKVSGEGAEIDTLFQSINTFKPDVVISSDNIYITGLFQNFGEEVVRISWCHLNKGYLARAAAAAPRHTDWIVALSHASNRILSRYGGVEPAAVRTVYNFLHNSSRNGGTSAEADLRVCYPGGRQRYKRPDTVARVAEILEARRSKIRVLWLGEPGGWPARLSRLGDRVQFLGRVSREDAREAYSRSTFFILPSDKEGCPMSLLEAMQVGCVPLVSDCESAMKEIVLHDHCGLVAAGDDPGQFADELLRLENDPARCVRLRSRARERALEMASEQKWLESVAQLFSRREGRLPPVFRPNRLRWHRRPGRWYKPTISYLRYRFGRPNLRSL